MNASFNFHNESAKTFFVSMEHCASVFSDIANSISEINPADISELAVLMIDTSEKGAKWHRIASHFHNLYVMAFKKSVLTALPGDIIFRHFAANLSYHNGKVSLCHKLKTFSYKRFQN